MTQIELREVRDSDLPIFFEQQRDPEAARMAAFTARDPSDQEAFRRHWERIRADSGALNRTIVWEGAVVGTVAAFKHDGRREVCFWIGREYWGRGIATAALSELLRGEDTRPIYAAAASDNHGSLRVLEKCGFKRYGRARGFANARDAEIDEFLLVLTD